MATRQLILIRHAKAADDGPTDIERPLSGRGQRDAAAIGTTLAGRGQSIDRAVVSPALRARQTWEAARKSLAGDVATDVDGRIYDNTVDALLAVIHDTPETALQLAVVGHNPSLAEFASVLDDGTGDSDARAALVSGLSTAAVAVFDVSVTWADLQSRSATLRSITVARGD